MWMKAAGALMPGEEMSTRPVWIEVRGDRIAEVALSDPGVKADVDLGTQYVMPGLIDAHVHLHPMGSGAASSWDEVRARAWSMLRAGVTTVRDVGAPSDYLPMRGDLNGRPGRGPWIQASGRPVTVAGGHGHHMGIAAVDSPSSMAEAVHAVAEEGADLVKIMATAGGSEGCQPYYTAASLRAAVEEAHSRGLRVAAHAHSAEGILRCVESGVDTIEHASFKEGDGFNFRDDIAREMAAAGIPAVITPVNYRKADLAGNRGRMRELEGYWRRLYELGVPVVIGTDVGVPHMLYHDSTVYSVSRLAAAGIPVRDALRAVGVQAARALGLGGETGEIRVGMRADLIAVADSPLDSLDVLKEVRWIMTRGRIAVQ